MGLVELHPDAAKRPYLHGGDYGPGLPHPADCEVVDYQFPAEEPPAFDRESPSENWAFIRIRCRTEEFGTIDIFHHEPITENSGSKLGQWLVAMNVPVEGDNFRHDTDQVIGRKVSVTVGDQRRDKQDPDKYYTGKLLQVMA